MCAFLLGLLLLFPSSAQNADAPGRIIGRVLIRGDNTPVAGARVMLMPVRRPPAPGTPTLSVTIGPPTGPPPPRLASADGWYAFDRIAPGEYRVSAQKTGLAEGPQMGQQQTAIVVEAGQAVECPDIYLDRGGAIAGRILDSNGEPLVDVRVTAMAPPPIPPQVLARGYRPPTNRPLMPSGHSAQTNDLGEFRVFGLLPGEYAVAANGQQNPFLAASTSPTTLTTTYFPGVTDQASAQRVSVAAGQTTSGIEIRMATAAAFLVSGIVVDTEGRPLEGAMVSVTSSTPMIGPHGLSRSDARGRFLIGSVTNGSYRVGVAGSSSGPGATMKLAEQMTITVADGNVSGLRLVMVPKQ
jgi:hypothetical protein